MISMFRRKLSIEDIRSQVPVRTRKRDARVLVIDDRVPATLDAMRGHGYVVSHIVDVRSIRECMDFDVVLCDVKGVGQHLAGRGQGAFLASKIKKEFPDKYVVLYTSAQLTVSEVKHGREIDEFLFKGADTESLIGMLERGVECSLNPYERWRRGRTGLLEEGLRLADLILLEDAYVRAIKSGDPKQFNSAIGSAGGAKEATHLLGSLSSFLALLLA